MFFYFIQSQVDEIGLVLLKEIANANEFSLISLKNASRSRQSLLLESSEFSEALEHICELDIIELDEDVYKFQVELIRRWFARL